MKKFLKTVLAVICGLLIFNLIGFAILMMFGSAFSTTEPIIPTSGILKVDLSKVIVAEQPREDLTFFLFYGANPDNRSASGHTGHQGCRTGPGSEMYLSQA